MRQGEVINFAQVDASVHSFLTNPIPMSDTESDTESDAEFEYSRLFDACSDFFQGIEAECIHRIESSSSRIYRSSEPIDLDARDPFAHRTPEIMTQYLTDSLSYKISKNIEPIVFVSLHYSCFRSTEFTLEQCNNLMGIWQEKTQKGLNEFVGKGAVKVEVMVYDDIEDIEANPVKYFAQSLNRESDLTDEDDESVLEATLPFVLIDCSPADNHRKFEFDFEEQLPEFILCFSLIDDSDQIDTSTLNQISEKVRSGFTIFQKLGPESDSMNSVAEVLKLSSVLCAKLIFGEDNEGTRAFDHLAYGAFLESRRTDKSKSSSSKLGSFYRRVPQYNQHGLKDLMSEWTAYRGNQTLKSLRGYYNAIYHCKYIVGDQPIRDMLDRTIHAWSFFTHNLAKIAGLANDVLETNPNPHFPPWARVTPNKRTKQTIEKIFQSKTDTSSSEDVNNFMKAVNKLLRHPTINIGINLSLSEVKTFYEEFTELVIQLKKMYYTASKLFHPNTVEDNMYLSMLNSYDVNFNIPVRMRLYDPIMKFLETYSEALDKFDSTNPNIATALKSVIKLDKVSGSC